MIALVSQHSSDESIVAGIRAGTSKPLAGSSRTRSIESPAVSPGGGSGKTILTPGENGIGGVGDDVIDVNRLSTQNLVGVARFGAVGKTLRATLILSATPRRETE
jgi:hypothetical protein